MPEIWKVYPLNSRYQVSNWGRIIGPKKNILRRIKVNHYWAVNLYFGNHVRRITRIHRMVLETFIGPAPDGCEACHNNGDKENNSLINLRWDTRKANVLDRIIHGTQANGERINTAKLTRDQVREIRKRHSGKNDSVKKLANEYGVAQSTIYCIINFKTWTRIK
jgi:hypothetical protein